MRKADEECLEKFADALEERGFFARRYEAGRLGDLWAAADALHSHCCALDNSNQRKALDLTPLLALGGLGITSSSSSGHSPTQRVG